MDDLRARGVDILTLGQYLRPTVNHLPVERFVTPEEFERYREWGSRAASANACPARWCARAIAPSRRWPATTSACTTAFDRDAGADAGAARAVARARALRAHLARHAALHRRRAAADTCDEIWLLEHAPVFTLGMNARSEHVLAAGDIPVVRIDRGGQVTYHGPGQLVVYPLIDVRRRNLGVRDLVGALERAVIDLRGCGSASRPQCRARCARGLRRTSASSRASACASAATAVTTAWRSTWTWTWSPFAASIPAATPASR